MSNNMFTETKHTSYGGNIKNAFGGMIVGLILFIGSFVILWFNEANNARQIQIANYITKNSVEVPSDSIDRANDGKLISTSARAYTQETLSDELMTVKKALVLNRKVEMYQWVEKKDTQSKTNVGGSTTETTTYRYEQEWSDREIDSEFFHKSGYVNPKFTIKSQRLNANAGALGKFKLTDTQTAEIHNLSQIIAKKPNNNFKIIDGMYYKGKDYANPQIGDIRISYSYAPSGTQISLTGEQTSNDVIKPMQMKFGKIYLQYDGLLTKKEMVEKFKKNNSILTWILRFVGWLLMFIGLNFIINPLTVIASFLPFLSGIVGFLTGAVMLVVSLALSLATIAIAWLVYRPLTSLILFALIIAIIIFAKNNINKKEI